jgi:hypothetical protein
VKRYDVDSQPADPASKMSRDSAMAARMTKKGHTVRDEDVSR